MRLWMWAISDGNAQRNGYLEGCDKEDIAEILNVGNNKNIDPDEVVAILIEDNWIECHEDGLYIHDWEEWQASWYDAIERKQRDKERKRRKRAEKREQELEKEKQKKAENEIKKENTKESKDIKEIELRRHRRKKKDTAALSKISGPYIQGRLEKAMRIRSTTQGSKTDGALMN